MVDRLIIISSLAACLWTKDPDGWIQLKTFLLWDNSANHLATPIIIIVTISTIISSTISIIKFPMQGTLTIIVIIMEVLKNKKMRHKCI